MLAAQASDVIAGEVLTEAEVIRLARSRAPAVVVARATELLAGAREETAGLLPNPRLSWARETVGSEAQDIVAATIPFDVARPLSARSLAASEAAGLRSEASVIAGEGVLEALLAYYELIHARSRAEILARAVSDLEEAARVLARREEAGSASGYEVARVAVALELARSERAEAQGDLHNVRIRLAAILDEDVVRPGDALELSPIPAKAELVRSATTTRDAVRHARAAERLAREADRRAGWAWLPVLELAGGLNHISGGRDGYVLGLALSLPIFDRGQALRAEAAARMELSRARSEALLRTVAAEVGAAHALYVAARGELDRFDASAAAHVETLLRAAQSGYREGERTILELLDAQRARTEAAERRIALLVAAKKAEARLRAAAGELR